MDNTFIPEYFEYQGCMNIEQGVNLWHLLSRVLAMSVEGVVAEIGCLTGITASVIQRTLEDAGSDKRLMLFDSFEGLSPLKPEDAGCPFNPAAFKTAPENVLSRFAVLDLKPPELIKGWVNDTLESNLPDAIAFVHLDLDLFEPTLCALKAIYKRLSPGAIVVIDDYYDTEKAQGIEVFYNKNVYNKNNRRVYALKDHCPGVKKACDLFFADKPEKPSVLIAGEEKHAYFVKK